MTTRTPRSALAFVAGALLYLLSALPGGAQSTINPSVPAQRSALTSGPVRANFQAAYNDINRLFSTIGTTINGYTNVATPFNTGIGFQAGNPGLLTGVNNAAFAYQALAGVTSGQGNVGVGKGTLAGLTSGSFNVGIGALSSQSLNSSNNVAIGATSLLGPTTSGNVAIGSLALENLTSGGPNVGIGLQALQTATTGTRLVGVGNVAGQALTNATDDVFVGDSAGSGVTTGSFDIGIGSRALQTQNAGFNIAIGPLAGTGVTGSFHICIGYESCFAGPTSTTAQSSIGIGVQTLLAMTSGTDNIAIGNTALQKILTASNSLAIGNRALANMIDGGAFFGANMAIGVDSLGACTTCSENTIVGRGAAEIMVTGDQTVGVGVQALQLAISSSFSACLGTTCLGGVTTGGTNTGIGQGSGYSTEGVDFAKACTTCDHSTFLGNSTTLASATQRSHVTVVGSNAFAGADTDNTVTLGRVSGGTVDITYAAAYAAGGTGPTSTAGTCVIVAGTKHGGNTVGDFAIPAGNCATSTTIILAFNTSAPVGWVCDMHNLNTPTSIFDQTAKSVNSATFTIRSVNSTAADVVNFKCMAY